MAIGSLSSNYWFLWTDGTIAMFSSSILFAPGVGADMQFLEFAWPWFWSTLIVQMGWKCLRIKTATQLRRFCGLKPPRWRFMLHIMCDCSILTSLDKNTWLNLQGDVISNGNWTQICLLMRPLLASAPPLACNVPVGNKDVVSLAEVTHFFQHDNT